MIQNLFDELISTLRPRAKNILVTGYLLTIFLSFVFSLGDIRNVIPQIIWIPSEGSIISEKRLPWLHVEGKFIVDENNKSVALRGGSTMYNSEGNKGLEQWVEGPDADGTMPGLFLRKGLNLMRLGFAPYTVANGNFEEVDIDVLEQNINYLGAHGIYSIINPHGFWADWSFVPGGKYPTPDSSSGWNYTTKKWREIALRLKDNPNLAAYEIYNEPWQGPLDEMREFLLDCIQTIRSVDDKHIIVHPEWLAGGHSAWDIQRYLDGQEDVMLWEPSMPHGEAYNMIGSIHYSWRDTRFFNDPAIGVYDSQTGRTNVNDDNDYGNPGVGKPLYTEHMALLSAARNVEMMLKYRNLMNEPIWAGELNIHDFNRTGISVQVFMREIIEQCEKYGIPWVWHELEKFTSYSAYLDRNMYDEMLPETFANVENGIVHLSHYDDDIPLPFNPKPFNLEKQIVGWTYKETSRNKWDVGRFMLNYGCYIDVNGPCRVRIRGWSNGYFSSDSVIDRDEIITIPQGSITRIIGTSSISDVYPYEDLSS